MSYYRNLIVIFGIVIPAIVAAVAVGAFSMVKSKMNASYENKVANFKSYEMTRLAELDVGSKVAREREHIERWNKQMSEATASSLTTNLRQIAGHLPSKEYQQTAFEPTNTKGGFGSNTAQNSSQLRIAFRGTFRTMQQAFLELETRMPQLQLQELKIDPSTGQTPQLNFQVSYTAWEN